MTTKRSEINLIILHDDKYQRFLEADTFIFDGHSQVSPDYPKQQVFNIICYISEKKKIMKLFFLHANKQTFLQVNAVNIGEYGQ